VRSQVVHLVYGLADHAMAIIGASLLAAIVVAMRRARQP
jgi:hypothetical protein